MARDNPEPQHAANFRRLLVPIQDRITLLDGDTEIVPGIEGVLAPGHTPGHMVVWVGKELAYTGDALLQPLHVAHPEWTAVWDLWPAETVESRRAFLTRLAAASPLVVGTHFPEPGTGRVRAEGEGWRWVSEAPPHRGRAVTLAPPPCPTSRGPVWGSAAEKPLEASWEKEGAR
jgi:glyoxylase-like metal-dependent hydrolase (beta-lactamase superfamily II)